MHVPVKQRLPAGEIKKLLSNLALDVSMISAKRRMGDGCDSRGSYDNRDGCNNRD